MTLPRALTRITAAFFVLSSSILVATASSCEDEGCVPGQSIACVGVAGCEGGQVCNADGTAYGACDCGEGGAGGSGSTTSSTASSTSGTTTSSSTGGGPTYPPGPYGTVEGSVIEDLSWSAAFIDGSDADKNPFNEATKPLALHDFYGTHDPAAKLVVLTSATGWCGPCQNWAMFLDTLQTDYGPQGVRFVVLYSEDAASDPPTEASTLAWGNAMSSEITTAVDPAFTLLDYVPVVAVPIAVIVRTSDMKIVYSNVGVLTEQDFRQVFDYYLANP